MKTLTLAPLSVGCLTKSQQQLFRNVTRYRTDVCAIQEVKVQQLLDTSLDNHRVIFFETKSPHHGNDFTVSLQLRNNVHKYRNVSDRVSVLQIKLSNTEKRAYNIKETSSEFKSSVSVKVQQNGVSYKCLPIPKITIKREFIPDTKHMISIINLYAPTSHLVRDDLSVLESFYNDVGTVLNELKNKSLVFLTGTGTLKQEKRSNNMPVTIALEVLLVVFEIIEDNKHLVDFCAIKNIFISNAVFQHKAAHITTWENNNEFIPKI